MRTQGRYEAGTATLRPFRSPHRRVTSRRSGVTALQRPPSDAGHQGSRRLVDRDGGDRCGGEGLRGTLTAVVVALTVLPLFSGCPDEPGDDDATVLSGYGESCAGDGDCVTGLRCAGNGTCLYPDEPGTAAEGDYCIATEYCLWGLVCDHDGVCARAGSPGTAGRGETCASDADCEAMMRCADGACYGFPVPLWPGVACADTDADTGPFRLLFEVPREGDIPDEFYRLPFPNDIRVHDGRLDLAGHPSPGALIPEFGDVVGTTIETLEQDVGGFGNNATVFFRFSDKLDYNTLKLGYPEDGATVYVVDITTGSDAYGTVQAVGYYVDANPGMYICDNWLALFNGPGRPYQAGHTFAAIVTTGVLQRDTGEPVQQDADFAALMADTPPEDPTLAEAWDVYQPFRDWVASSGMDPANIAGAAVFTVQDPIQEAQAVREAVRQTDPPAAAGLHLCEAGDPGPYADPDDPERGCGPTSDLYYEIQGTLTVPVFQEGTPPYKDAADGGDVHRNPDGTIAPVGEETVVFALTIPKAERPPNGWPLVVFAHGAGGNYRSFVTGGVADWLSDITTDDGTQVGFAILGIDQLFSGPRAHPENWDEAWLAYDPDAYQPDTLFYNVLNPRAARTNLLQAAADDFQLVRLAESLVWTAEESPIGDAVYFDTDNIYFVGHGLGAVGGVACLAWEPLVHAGVLAAGGVLDAEILSNKSRPVDLAAMVRAAVADPDIARHHPAVNLMQAVLERSDPVDYAESVLRFPQEGVGPHHLLMVYGLDDPYVPEWAQYALIKGLHIPQMPNGHEQLESVSTVSGDVSGNIWIDGGSVTGAGPLYVATGGGNVDDALYEDEDARFQVSQFLATAVRDRVPTIPALE